MTTQALKKWNKVKLGDVAEIESGGTPSSTKSEYWDGGNICWATLPDLKNKYIFDTQRKITPLGLKNSSAKLLPINSVIFSSRATIGEVSIAKVEISTNQGSKNFICNPTKIDYEFLYYLLKSKVEEINSLASGATYKEINKTVFSSVEVEIPNIPTQKQIADVLSTYDDLIENNSHRIQILEQMAQVVYTEWFVKFRFPGHEKVKMIDSGTDFGKIPQGWIVKKLGEKIDISRGKNITKKTIDEGNIPVVAGGLEPAYFHNTPNTEAPVVTVSASGANAGFVNLYMENVWASDCSYIDKKTTPFVLYYFLFLKSRQIEITGLQRGSAQPHVYPKDLSGLLIVDAPDYLIGGFEKIVDVLFSLIGNLREQNKKLRAKRDLLLPKLVTGEITVK